MKFLLFQIKQFIAEHLKYFKSVYGEWFEEEEISNFVCLANNYEMKNFLCEAP